MSVVAAFTVPRHSRGHKSKTVRHSRTSTTMKLLVAICAVLVAARATKLPSNFKTCNRRSPNFNSCLLEAARHGVTQLNRPYKQFKMINLEPLSIPKIVATVETPLVNVTSILTDCKFWGLTGAEIEKFEIDFDKKTIYLAGLWPDLKSQCYFDMDGQIFRSLVKGQGPSSATYKNFRWTFNLSYEEVRRKDKTYVKATSAKFDGKPETLSMNMEGLFDGDKELAQRANKIINDNWSDLYDDVKWQYLDNASKTWLQIMSGWFSRLSLEEAFDN